MKTIRVLIRKTRAAYLLQAYGALQERRGKSDEALELYEQAHAAGNAGATYHMGVMYDQGYGVEENQSKAIEMYKQALGMI